MLKKFRGLKLTFIVYFFLIVCTSGANVNAQAADLATALLIASQEGHQACVDLLLDNGADPNVACSSDWFQLAIHAAAQFGHLRYNHTLTRLPNNTFGAQQICF